MLPVTFRPSGLIRLTLVVAWMASAAAKAAPAPATQAALSPRIVEMHDYYAKLYAQPLGLKDRLARLVGIVSLSRIDGPPLTKALLAVLKDQDVLIAQFAWE